MANLWRDAVPTSNSLDAIATQSPSSTLSPTATGCAEYFVPAGTLVFYDTQQDQLMTIQISTSGLYYPGCAADDLDALIETSSLMYQEPFYGSVIPMAYSLAASTVVAWLLLILLFIAQKKRPWFQKFTTLFVASSLTVFLAQATSMLERQYYAGYYDASELRHAIFGGMPFRVLEVFMTLFVWIAHLQVLLRLFERPKERRVIRVIGAILAICDTVMWSLVNFVVPRHSHNQSIHDIIPVLAYLFQIALSVVYAVAVVLYSIRKRRFAYSRKQQPAGLIVAIISLTTITLPLIFFILDLAQYWLTGWSEFIRWVSDVAASIVLWEWVDVIEKQEREEQKSGVLGRQIFEENDPEFYQARFQLDDKGEKKRIAKKSTKHPAPWRQGVSRWKSRHARNNSGGRDDGDGDEHGNNMEMSTMSQSAGGARRTVPPGRHSNDSQDSSASTSHTVAPSNSTEDSSPPNENTLQHTSNSRPAQESEQADKPEDESQNQGQQQYGSGGTVNGATNYSGSTSRYWPFSLFFRNPRGWVISRASSTASSSTSYGTQVYINSMDRPSPSPESRNAQPARSALSRSESLAASRPATRPGSQDINHQHNHPHFSHYGPPAIAGPNQLVSASPSLPFTTPNSATPSASVSPEPHAHLSANNLQSNAEPVSGSYVQPHPYLGWPEEQRQIHQPHSTSPTSVAASLVAPSPLSAQSIRSHQFPRESPPINTESHTQQMQSNGVVVIPEGAPSAIGSTTSASGGSAAGVASTADKGMTKYVYPLRRNTRTSNSKSSASSSRSSTSTAQDNSHTHHGSSAHQEHETGQPGRINANHSPLPDIQEGRVMTSSGPVIGVRTHAAPTPQSYTGAPPPFSMQTDGSGAGGSMAIDEDDLLDDMPNVGPSHIPELPPDFVPHSGFSAGDYWDDKEQPPAHQDAESAPSSSSSPH